MNPLEPSEPIPAPISGELALPSRIPLLPGSILKRFGGEAEEFNEQLERFWKKVQLNLSEAFEQQVAVPQNRAAEEMEQLTARYETDTATLTAAINEEKVVRANADSALALRASSLEVSINTPDTGLLARVATIESAYVDEDMAEAIFALKLLAELTGPTGSIYAAIDEERTARVNAVSALAERTTDLEASIDTPTTGLLARVSTIESAYVDSTGAYAQAVSAITAELTGPTGSIYASVKGEETARVNADSALALRADALEASVDTPTTGLLARVSTIESAYVDEDEAESIAKSEITAALSGPSGDIYAAIGIEAAARADADGAIHARWGVSIDVNGNIVGRINLDGTNETSEFKIDVTKFTVANSSLGITPFQIVGSKARFTSDVEIDGSLLIAGTLTLSQVGGAGSLASKSSVDLASDVTNKSLSNLDPSANSKLASISSGADVTLAALQGGLVITSGGITLNGSPSIKSNNYSAGVAGWAIKGDGSVEFADGTFRGQVITTGDIKVNATGSLPGSGNTHTGFHVEAHAGTIYCSRNDNVAANFNRNNNGPVTTYRHNGSQVGSATVSAIGTAFNTTSDERLKTNIEDAEYADIIDGIRVREFEFVKDTSCRRIRGFIAQELYEVVPDAVTVGGEDPESEPWMVEYSKLMPILVLELQSLRRRVALLEA